MPVATNAIRRGNRATGNPTATPPGPGSRTTVVEDLIAVLLSACLIGGAMADGWAHVNRGETLEGFFTPWHGLLYAGFAGSAAWTFWLAYQRRARAPFWWRNGWPDGYRIGALGVLIFTVGGLTDMIWHETLGVEIGINAQFSPSHQLIVIGAVLIVSSPLRSWWAAQDGGIRTATAVTSLTLAVMAPTILLTHSSALLTVAPTQPYDPAVDPFGVSAVAGIDSYLVTTVLLVAPVLWILRRRAVPGAATAVTFGVCLFMMVMFQFPAPEAAGTLGALCAAAVADVLLVRLDRVRGTTATLRLPLAGAVLAALLWTGHLVGLHVAAGLRWPAEMIGGIVVLTAILGAVLGGLAARPATHHDGGATTTAAQRPASVEG